VHGVIMAGGRGSRLQPLTDHRPKPMVPLLGRPVIDHVKDAMLKAGVDRLIVTTGYRGEDLASHVNTWAKNGTRARVNHETTPMGTVGSVRLLIDELTETFLVGSGDGVSTLDLGHLLDHHRSTGALVTIGLVEVNDPSGFGIVGLAEDRHGEVDGNIHKGFVRRFLEKPAPEQAFSRLINAGVYAVEPAALHYVPEGEPFDFSRDLFPLLLTEDEPIAGIKLDGVWFDVGAPHHLLDAQATLLGDRHANHLHAGVVVEDGATISASMLMENSYVEANARVDRSILGAGARVGRGALLYGCVIGDGEVVHPGEHLVDVRRPPE
jgi:NDP-sugar pyrophosphorylase family protein